LRFDIVRTTITKNVSCRAKVEGVSLLRGYDTGERKMTRGNGASAAIPRALQNCQGWKNKNLTHVQIITKLNEFFFIFIYLL